MQLQQDFHKNGNEGSSSGALFQMLMRLVNQRDKIPTIGPGDY
jgi:hypothetical protein